MELLYDYGLFFLKILTFLVLILLVFGLIASLSQRQKESKRGSIEVNVYNDTLDEMKHALLRVVEDEAALKKALKLKHKASQKAKKELSADRKAGKAVTKKKRVFVMDFNGDIRASAVAEMREVITAILTMATPNDEVVLRLESSGGMVHSYGLAASQLHRLREREIPLTICIDKVAASGGYMMACVGNKIFSAPFAVLGSIGVVAQLPNFNKVLKKNDIDYEQFTAGEYKRTLTLFGKNSDKSRQKFMEDLELTHVLFKQFVKQHRSFVNIDEVATGEVWFGSQALDKKLVDELSNSDDYITRLADNHPVFIVSYHLKKGFMEKLQLSVQSGIERAAIGLFERVATHRFFH